MFFLLKCFFKLKYVFLNLKIFLKVKKMENGNVHICRKTNLDVLLRQTMKGKDCFSSHFEEIRTQDLSGVELNYAFGRI
jgi:hypothetical protein